MNTTRVTFSGGGAKGVFYVGVCDALEQNGIIENLTDIAGTSSGAISASLIALGIKSNKLRDALVNTDLTALKGKVVDYAFYTRDGNPLLEEIRKNITDTVSDFFTDIQLDDDNHDLKAIKNKVTSSPRGAITFADLATLRSYDKQRFKNLTITAVKHPSGELQVFNSTDTPDVEIALACRASSSLPIIFQPVKININGVDQNFIDGGMWDNTPTDYFDKTEDGKFTNNKKDETLVFVFGTTLQNNRSDSLQTINTQITENLLTKLINDALETKGNSAKSLKYFIKQTLNSYVAQQDWRTNEADPVIKALGLLTSEELNQKKPEEISKLLLTTIELLPFYKPSFFDRLIRNTFIKWFAGFSAYKNTRRQAFVLKNLRENYIKKTIQLRTGELGTIDFDKAKKNSDLFVSLGYLDTIEHLFENKLNKEIKNSLGVNINTKENFDQSILDEFNKIYTSEDFTKINSYAKTKSATEIVWGLIKPAAEKQPGSSIARALSTAVKNYNDKEAGSKLTQKFKHQLEQINNSNPDGNDEEPPLSYCL